MNRITYQLIPKGGMSKADISADAGNDKVIRISETGGLTEIHLNDGSLIELGELGNVRYSVFEDNLDSISYAETYNTAIDTISDIVHSDVEKYKLCLIINSEDVTKTYHDQKNQIEKFALSEFNISNTDQSDIGHHSVKFSLSPHTSYVRV